MRLDPLRIHNLQADATPRAVTRRARGSPCSTLRRVNTANSTDPGDPVVENVVPGGLSLHLPHERRHSLLPPVEGEIAKVRVSLVITVDPGTQNAATQRLTTEIDLRNR